MSSHSSMNLCQSRLQIRLVQQILIFQFRMLSERDGMSEFLWYDYFIVNHKLINLLKLLCTLCNAQLLGSFALLFYDDSMVLVGSVKYSLRERIRNSFIEFLLNYSILS